jgi:hypothetical protein
MWLWVVLILLIPSVALAEVGSVTEFRGNPAQAQRESEQLIVEMGFGIEMLDQLITANTRLGLTFEDGTRVEITEQSQLVVDDFVYDPNTGTGRMAMNVALGTVQMASGRLARGNRENVNITTPTASITVRGTDFSMTVDELGRSLIILLPSCPDETLNEDECPVGAITVSTDAGSVILDEPYQGTLVSHSGLMPADPRRLLLERANINNNLIIVPPAEFPRGFAADDDEDELYNALDIDFFEYENLSEDLLATNELFTSALDVNRLGNTFLDNLLDITGASLGNELDEMENLVLPNIRNFPWIQAAVNEEFILLDSERLPHIAMLVTGVDTQGTYNLTQDEISASIQINYGGTDVNIRIVQTQ